jgi:hypothetical protein
MRERASEEVTLAAWDDLKAAILRVECALPFRMSAAMGDLVEQYRAFEQILLRRDRPVTRAPDACPTPGMPKEPFK